MDGFVEHKAYWRWMRAARNCGKVRPVDSPLDGVLTTLCSRRTPESTAREHRVTAVSG